MKILGIDLGSTTGWYCDGESGTILLKSKTVKFTPQTCYFQFLSTLNDIDPDVVISAKGFANNHANSRQYGKYEAVLELVCEELNMEYEEVADITARKHVLGFCRVTKEEKAEGIKLKDKVMEAVGETNDHIADAKVVSLYFKQL